MIGGGSRFLAGYALLAAAGVVLIAAALFVTGVLGGEPPLTGTDLGERPAPISC